MKCLVLFLSLFASFQSFGASVVSITTTTLPNGTVGTSYRATINAAGGCTPYRWTITGSLPAGLQSVLASKGISLTLAGTPTTAGTFTFSATVTGCGWHKSQMSYTVVIQSVAVHAVDLTWGASTSPNLAGYNMYRGHDGVNWQRINSGGLIASTLYCDLTAANGSTYYYAATAVNISGEESAKSTPIQVAIP